MIGNFNTTQSSNFKYEDFLNGVTKTDLVVPAPQTIILEDLDTTEFDSETFPPPPPISDPPIVPVVLATKPIRLLEDEGNTLRMIALRYTSDKFTQSEKLDEIAEAWLELIRSERFRLRAFYGDSNAILTENFYKLDILHAYFKYYFAHRYDLIQEVFQPSFNINLANEHVTELNDLLLILERNSDLAAAMGSNLEIFKIQIVKALLRLLENLFEDLSSRQAGELALKILKILFKHARDPLFTGVDIFREGDDEVEGCLLDDVIYRGSYHNIARRIRRILDNSPYKDLNRLPPYSEG